MDMLADNHTLTTNFRSAVSWFLSSDIRVSCGFASSRRLLLQCIYASAIDKRRIPFMVTSEDEALAALRRCQPGLLVVTSRLDQGDGLSLVSRARTQVPDIRTIMICDHQSDDLGGICSSEVDAAFCEEELGTQAQPLKQLVIALSLGRRYRSPLLQRTLHGDENQVASAGRDGVPALTSREQELIDLWVEGLSDRDVAGRLGLSYATVRGYGRDLRKKLGVGSRTQVVLKAVSLGLGRISGPSAGP